MLDSDDLAAFLCRRSDKRRAMRLGAIGLTAAEVAEVSKVIDYEAPEIRSGSGAMVIGVLGEGKSETAEQWHRWGINQLNQNEISPIPIWLSARELLSTRLEDAIAGFLGSAELALERGVRLVVDGLDEIPPDRADSLISQAQLWVAGSPRSSFLVTSRTSSLASDDTIKTIVPPPMSEDTKSLILQSLCGSTWADWRWPEALQGLGRPFVLLAAAKYSQEAGPKVSQPDLLRLVAEAAISKTTKESAVEGSSIYRSLTELAKATVQSGGAAQKMHPGQRFDCLATRLVAEDGNGRLYFSLAVLEQWFAAQALIADQELRTTATADIASVARWRWSLALAIAVGDETVCDDIVARLLLVDVGLGAGVLELCTSDNPAISDDADIESLRGRWSMTTRAWIDALGELAQWVFPVASSVEPVRTGLNVTNKIVTTAWYRGRALVDECVELTEPLDPFNLNSETDWRFESYGQRTGGNAWPWQFRRDQVSRSLADILSAPRPYTGRLGIWANELRYARICQIAGQRANPYKPLKRTAALEALTELMEMPAIIGSDVVRFTTAAVRYGQLPGYDVSHEELHELLRYVSDLPNDAEFVPCPFPMADSLATMEPYVWSPFSQSRLLEYALVVLGGACMAYEEVCSTLLKSVSPTFSGYLQGPLVVVGCLAARRDESGGIPRHQPSIGYELLPRAYAEEYRDLHGYRKSENGRAYLMLSESADQVWQMSHDRKEDQRVRDWLEYNGVALSQPRTSWTNAMLNVTSPRPASSIAVSWLGRDLKHAGLFSGNSRGLEY